MSSLLEQSLKKRLQLLANERNLTPAVVWQNVISDRFLVRLCQSRFRTNFILKGGTLLAKHLNIGRETRDLDFSVENLNCDVKELKDVIEEVISIKVEDGFDFKSVKIESVNHFHVNYPGAQLRIDACFGRTQFSLFIDLGFGDHVKVKEESLLLLANSKGPLFETDVNVVCYPLEFVFAEKLETVCYRGVDNSRMKDFHDLLTMVNHSELLNDQEIHSAIKAVFGHRGTMLNIPLTFDESSKLKLQSLWQRYRPSIVFPDSLPLNVEDVIESINSYLKN